MSTQGPVTYVLRSGARTYVGATVDLRRRLRQHNGQLAGGARRTRGRQWEVHFFVEHFEDFRAALSFEWHLKHAGRRARRFTPEARLEHATAMLREPLKIVPCGGTRVPIAVQAASIEGLFPAERAVRVNLALAEQDASAANALLVQHCEDAR